MVDIMAQLHMVQQKMVIKLKVDSDDDRSRAMKIAATAYGLISVAMEGGDALVVIGEGVDPVTLTDALRKKVRCPRKKIRCADLVLLEEEKPEPKPEEKKEKKKEKEKDKEKEQKKEEKPSQPSHKFPVCQPPFPPCWEVYPYPHPTGCSFM